MKHRKLKCLVVDDHEYFRQSLADFLKTMPFVKVVGEAQNGFEAVEIAMTFSPHVIFMDVRMPFYDGIEAAKQIKKYNQAIRVILYSAYDCEIYQSNKDLLSNEFISKDRLFAELPRIIEKASKEIIKK